MLKAAQRCRSGLCSSTNRCWPQHSLQVPAALAVPVARLGLHIWLGAQPAGGAVRARRAAVGCPVGTRGGCAVGTRWRSTVVAGARRCAVGRRRPTIVAPIALSVRISPRRRLPWCAVALWWVGPARPAWVPARPARWRRADCRRPRWLRGVRARCPTLLALGPMRKVVGPTRRARPVPACATTARRTTTGPAGGTRSDTLSDTRSATHAQGRAQGALRSSLERFLGGEAAPGSSCPQRPTHVQVLCPADVPGRPRDGTNTSGVPKLSAGAAALPCPAPPAICNPLYCSYLAWSRHGRRHHRRLQKESERQRN